MVYLAQNYEQFYIQASKIYQICISKKIIGTFIARITCAKTFGAARCEQTYTAKALPLQPNL